MEPKKCSECNYALPFCRCLHAKQHSELRKKEWKIYLSKPKEGSEGFGISTETGGLTSLIQCITGLNDARLSTSHPSGAQRCQTEIGQLTNQKATTFRLLDHTQKQLRRPSCFLVIFKLYQLKEAQNRALLRVPLMSPAGVSRVFVSKSVRLPCHILGYRALRVELC